MTSITKAQQAKAAIILNKLIRYPEGVMTRKAWLEMKKAAGATVEQAQKPLVDYNRRKFNRMNYQEQAEYEIKCNTLVPDFRIYPDSGRSYYEITKTEFDYFQSL